jgi:hypothetical protein
MELLAIVVVLAAAQACAALVVALGALLVKAVR